MRIQEIRILIKAFKIEKYDLSMNIECLLHICLCDRVRLSNLFGLESTFEYIWTF